MFTKNASINYYFSIHYITIIFKYLNVKYYESLLNRANVNIIVNLYTKNTFYSTFLYKFVYENMNNNVLMDCFY